MAMNTQHPQHAAQGQMQVRNVFPTPIAIFLLPDAQRINSALQERIFQRETSVASVHKSNWGGWQSPDDFETWCGPEGEAVLNMARQMGGQLTSDRQGGQMNPEWVVNAWANVNREGQGNEFHTHPGAFWSATYYVRDGGVADNPDFGGEFEMADPRGVAPAMLAPHFAFGTPGGQAVGASELIRPRAGMMVMFPSWLSHGVRPYRGNDVRISIALNLTPV